MPEVRRRRIIDNKNDALNKPRESEQIAKEDETTSSERLENADVSNSLKIQTGSFWLTRVVFIRSIAFIYFVAFLVALNQNESLLGNDGLLPAKLQLQQIKNRAESPLSAFFMVPSILLFLDDYSNLNWYLNAISLLGLLLSTSILISGASNMIAMFLLWILYQSLVNIGQIWYSFGWESQLLETGFLTIFLCPIISWKKIPNHAPSKIMIWGYRWLLFRIMIGAGLIKIRGDKCWTNLTCMNYHYQTQPVPNPISYFMHQTPVLFHKFETLSNHFIELVVPWLTFTPRKGQMFCGFIQIFFQIVLIISGNLSFLNWLTILPSIWYFDDASLSFLFDKSTVKKVKKLQQSSPKSGSKLRRCIHLIVGLLIAYLSIPVVINLLSTKQKMNYTFDPFRLVNTYGAFGSVTKERTEIILEGTYDLNPHDPSAQWLEYEFKCKPGNVTKRPCLISPYHYRLDWLAWFAAFQTYHHNPWLIHLTGKLLVNDPIATSLLAFNPFDSEKPPRYIRALHYKYTFTKIGGKNAKNGKWWNRKKIGNYFPAVSLSNLLDIYKTFEWNFPLDPYAIE